MAYATVTPYADETYALAYITDRKSAADLAVWVANTDKAKLLVEGTLLIDSLPLTGTKTVDTQAREFPRGGDAAVDDRVLNANVESAFQASLGNTMDDLRGESGVSSESTGGASMSYQGQKRTILTRTNGLFNSIEGFKQIAPWLLNPQLVSLERK